MFRQSAAAIVVALGIGSSCQAADAYKIDTNHTDLLFSIEHAGFTHKHGSFRQFAGELQYDEAQPGNSKVTVVVQTASLDTAHPGRDQDLKSEKFFDVAKYPEMRFESTKIVPGKDQEFRVEGNLTLHGVTKPLVLAAKLNKAGPNPFDKTPTLGFTATGVLKRSDFGITTFLPMIGDTVEITIDAEFRRAQ
jgi:polyisoprenoid-binding protein YceI